MKFTHTEKQLGLFIDDAVESAQLELGTTRTIRGRKVRRVASGDLQNSLFGKMFKERGKLSINFGSTANYAMYIHEGVNGTLVDNGAPFNFKSKMINLGAVGGANLDGKGGWMKRKKIRPRSAPTKTEKGTIGGRKFKANVTDGTDNLKALMFAIATSIAQKGIIGVPYMTKGVERSFKKHKDRIADAFARDAANDLDL